MYPTPSDDSSPVSGWCEEKDVDLPETMLLLSNLSFSTTVASMNKATDSMSARCSSKASKKKRPEGYVPRPLNSFIMFRKSFCRKWDKGGDGKMLSAAASNAWWALTNEQRKLWKDKSKEAAKLHKINNPGYVFRPTKRQERKNPTKQTKRSKPCPQSSKSAKSDGDQTQRQQCGEVTDTSTVESAAHPQNVTENMEIEIQNMLAPVPALTNPALMDVDLTMPVWFPPQPGSGAVDPLDLSYISPSTSSSASSGYDDSEFWNNFTTPNNLNLEYPSPTGQDAVLLLNDTRDFAGNIQGGYTPIFDSQYLRYGQLDFSSGKPACKAANAFHPDSYSSSPPSASGQNLLLNPLLCNLESQWW